MRSVDQAGKPRRLAVFDLETTGIDVDRDRIVTCFIGLLDGDGAVLDERRWLLDPSVEIPPDGAQAVHGISTSMARAHGQPASSGVQQIATALQWVVDHGLPVVAHNGGYDLSLLTAETRRHGVPVVRGLVMIDTYVIDKALDRYRPGSRSSPTSPPTTVSPWAMTRMMPAPTRSPPGVSPWHCTTGSRNA